MGRRSTRRIATQIACAGLAMAGCSHSHSPTPAPTATTLPSIGPGTAASTQTYVGQKGKHLLSVDQLTAELISNVSASHCSQAQNTLDELGGPDKVSAEGGSAPDPVLGELAVDEYIELQKALKTCASGKYLDLTTLNSIHTLIDQRLRALGVNQ